MNYKSKLLPVASLLFLLFAGFANTRVHAQTDALVVDESGKVGVNTGDQTTAQTREHILLARQIGTVSCLLLFGQPELPIADFLQVFVADFDDDGEVDGADFLNWQRGFGGTANFDDDGDVDGADFLVWQRG